MSQEKAMSDDLEAKAQKMDAVICGEYNLWNVHERQAWLMANLATIEAQAKRAMFERTRERAAQLCERRWAMGGILIRGLAMSLDTETRKAIEAFIHSAGASTYKVWLRQCFEEIDSVTKLTSRAANEIMDLESKLKACMEALEPFAQSEFSRELGGNVQGDESPIFERNGQRLTLGDFRRAKAALDQAK